MERWVSAEGDIMKIRTVIHVEEPYGMIEFEQEVGRGGGSGEIVQSLMLSDEEMSEYGTFQGQHLE